MNDDTTRTFREPDDLQPAEGLDHGIARRDMLCFSHLRWDFVFQRPQHLMTRFAATRRVFYIEEPVFEAIEAPRLRVSPREAGLHIVTPLLPLAMQHAPDDGLRTLVDQLLAQYAITRFDAWYYTPMSLAFSAHLAPQRVVYDCMDELRNFLHAPTAMAAAEDALLARADVVFTGGRSLYEAKRTRHDNVHAFPSSIDRAHFAKARTALATPADQAALPQPRLGFFGVIDERFDIALVDAVAQLRPDWQLVLVGPVVKIDPGALPRHANVHYLGMKTYAELPAYLAGWDVAIMPFARNDATRFISPTKTPEYLAGGVPVVSTTIHDVVHPYGDLGLIGIADTGAEFVAACERAMAMRDAAWLARVDAFIAPQSWDATWLAMVALIEQPRTVARVASAGVP